MGKMKVVGISFVICAVLGSGIYGVNRAAESRVREVIAQRLAEKGLTDRVSYGALSINPLNQQVTVTDVVVEGQNDEDWRIDQLQVFNYLKDKNGYPLQVEGALKGIHIPLSRLQKNCGVLCSYVDVFGAQGVKELLVDMDMSYEMQDDEKRFDLAGNVALRDYASFSFMSNIGGLASSDIQKAYTQVSENVQSGMSPMASVAMAGLSLRHDQSIAQLDVGALGFGVTDHGEIERTIKFLAKSEGDTRPMAELRQEQWLGIQEYVHNSILHQVLPMPLYDSLEASLEGYVLHGKPLRFMTHATKPVLLMERDGAGALRLVPEVFQPAQVYKALAPAFDNIPLS